MLFPSESVDILKLDFLFEAGTCYQPLPLCASSTVTLMPVATASCTPQQVAEFVDRRGILIDTNSDLHVTALTAYLLPRYAEEFFPLLREMLTSPAFPESEVQAHCRRSRHRLTTNFQRTAYVARNLFCQAIYGEDRPEGRFAVPADVDRITPALLHDYFQQHYRLDAAVCSLSGHYDDTTLRLFRSCFGDPESGISTRVVTPSEEPLRVVSQRQQIRHQLEVSGPQASIRVGRLLPFMAQDADYAPFAVLCTVLGGYFGSRLMRNIREEKGYTYGIHCRTRLYRTSLYFEILSDVATDVVDAALEEVYTEMDDLCQHPVSDEELQVVRSYMEGEYLRSIDGIFERADRWQQLAMLGIDEKSFSERLLHAIHHTTAEQLQQLAQRYLTRDTMTEVVVF